LFVAIYIPRKSVRVPLEMSLNTFAAEAQERCVSVNLGTRGLYLLRQRRPEPMPRASPVLQLEFELPGTSEVIWARGEVAFDRVNPHICGSGVRFAAMADRHWGLVRDYVIEQRMEHYRNLWARIAAETQARPDGRPGRSAGAWSRRWGGEASALRPAPLWSGGLLSPPDRYAGDGIDGLQSLVALFRDPRPHAAGWATPRRDLHGPC
jgi:hypothetical protein